jgi:Domain of unknown function (DUF5666)
VRPHSIIMALAAAALIAVPSLATAAPDQNTQPGQYNNGCNGQWVNGQCVNNGQWNNGHNNGRWNNDERNRERERERQRERERWQREHQNNGNYNNGQWNNGRYGNNGYGGYGNNGYGNGYGYGNNGNLTGVVSSFSPYNLYLNNGLHVVLHDGTVINPRGTNLTAGQRVRIVGYRNQDGTFAANEIDVVGSGNGYYRY